MTSHNYRNQIQGVAILLVLAAISVGWYFTRPQTVPRRSVEESAEASSPRTKASERSAPDPARELRRQQSISLAGQKWYEELLVKYPQMKPTYRDVPDEQNGFLQFLLLAESLKEPKLPADLHDMLRGDSPWDHDKFKAWLASNKDYVEQILHLAELPDRSIKGLDFSRLAHGSARISSEFGIILTTSARVAFAEGDQDSALRFGKASISLSNHFTAIEVPTVLGAVVAEEIRRSARESFLENILPGLADNAQALASWRDTLLQKQSPASEGTRFLTGEWNVMMRENVLPALLGKNPATSGEISFQVPGTDEFFDCYTAATLKLAASLSNSGPDRFDLTQNELEFPKSEIDPQTLQMLQDVGSQYRGIFKAFGTNHTHAAMISAAVNVQLGEDPGIDPVSGKPFQWDPISRTLTPPQGIEGPDPIKLR